MEEVAAVVDISGIYKVDISYMEEVALSSFASV